MPGGRPTDYKPEYCEQVIQAGRDGYSLTAFAGMIGVARSTINHWAGLHEEFSEALETHKAVRAVWWEDRARSVASAGGGSGQGAMIMFGLRNVAPDEFKEKRDHEISGPGGSPLQVERIERVVVDPEASDD